MSRAVQPIVGHIETTLNAVVDEAVDLKKLDREKARQTFALAAFIATLKPTGVLTEHKNLGDFGDDEETEKIRIGVRARLERDRGGRSRSGPARAPALRGDLHSKSRDGDRVSPPACHQRVIAFDGGDDRVGARRLDASGIGRSFLESIVVLKTIMCGDAAVRQTCSDESHNRSSCILFWVMLLAPHSRATFFILYSEGVWTVTALG